MILQIEKGIQEATAGIIQDFHKDNTMVNIEQGDAAGQSLGAGVMDTATMMKKGMDKATGY